MTTPQRIGILAYPSVQALDIVGPADAFAAAISEHGQPLYEVVLLSSKVVASESGIAFQPQCSLGNSPVSARHFNRLFRDSFGSTPADFVEKLRLGEARLFLDERGSRIDSIALAAGFASSDFFRRAFERRFGLAPAAYRGRSQAKTPCRAKSSSFRSPRRSYA